MPVVLEDDNFCYACGTENPEGFRLAFIPEGDTLRTEVVFRPEHQGYARIIHGGFVALVLDEVMANLPYRLWGIPVVAVHMEVRFRHPVPPGVPIAVAGRLVSRRGRRFELASDARLPDGRVAAEGRGVCLSQ